MNFEMHKEKGVSSYTLWEGKNMILFGFKNGKVRILNSAYKGVLLN
jgi:hypothetical protein